MSRPTGWPSVDVNLESRIARGKGAKDRDVLFPPCSGGESARYISMKDLPIR